MRNRIVWLVLLVLGLSPLSTGSATARVECAAAENVESYDVTAEPRRKVYRIGQTALVDVEVMDSLTGAPVGDVDTGLVILGRGKRSPYGIGRTDAEGRVTLAIRLSRSSVDPGWAHAFVGAYKPIVTPVYCTARYGQREYKKLFRIRG